MRSLVFVKCGEGDKEDSVGYTLVFLDLKPRKYSEAPSDSQWIVDPTRGDVKVHGQACIRDVGWR